MLFLIQIEAIHERRRKLSRKANKIESSGLDFIVHVLFVANTSSLATDSGNNYLIGMRLFMQSSQAGFFGVNK